MFVRKKNTIYIHLLNNILFLTINYDWSKQLKTSVISICGVNK